MDIKNEIVIYLLIAGILSAVRRVISGAKNGCFYAKNNTSLGYPPLLEKFIKNIHFLETPAWYSHLGLQFFLCLAIYRLCDTHQGAYGLSAYTLSFVGALLSAMGSSAIAGVFYQGYINVGSGQSFIDSGENPKSEFAFWKWSFWWYRPVYGKRRIYASILGVFTLLGGIYLGVYY